MADNPGFSREDGVRLREHLEASIAGLEKLMDTKLNGIARTTDAVARDLDRRLEGMNEFRAQLEAQAKTLANKAEVELELKRIRDQIEAMQMWQHRQEGKASQQSVNVALLMALVGLLLSATGLALNLLG